MSVAFATGLITMLTLTKLQTEILSALRDGQLLTLDNYNMPFLDERALQPQIRYFLTENRLITRKDTTRAVDAKGNGFTISKKGLALLKAQNSNTNASSKKQT